MSVEVISVLLIWFASHSGWLANQGFKMVLSK